MKVEELDLVRLSVLVNSLFLDVFMKLRKEMN